PPYQTAHDPVDGAKASRLVLTSTAAVAVAPANLALAGSQTYTMVFKVRASHPETVRARLNNAYHGPTHTLTPGEWTEIRITGAAGSTPNTLTTGLNVSPAPRPYGSTIDLDEAVIVEGD